MSSQMLVADIGTQSLRVTIVDESGEFIKFAQKKYEEPYFSLKDGWAEQNADYYMDILSSLTLGMVKEDPAVFDGVTGMVVVDFRDSTVLLDEDKRPIRPCILWLDQRVTRIPGMKYLRGYEKLLFSAIGMTDTVKFNAERTPSHWYMKNEPENWNRMRYYAPLGAYFNYQITGNLVLSPADCIGHYPINFKKGTWLPKIHPKINVFGIPLDKLPPLVPLASVIGTVTKEFSEKSGIPEGLPLYASGSDKCCETYGNGATQPDIASISLGTACSIDVVDGKYSEPERFLPSYPAPYKGAYDLEVQIYRGFWMIKWYLDNFGCNDIAEAEKEGICVEEYINRKVSEISPGSDGLVLQPYWGPGLKRPNAKGSIVGFSGVHSRYHLFRAIYEGLAFALREGLDAIVKKTHRVPDKIVVSGGGSKSKIMLQILADVFGITVYPTLNPESSTLGGAMSGFLATGVYKTPEEASKAMVKWDEPIQPIKENHEMYNRLYKTVYVRMYPSLAKIYANCKDFFLTNNNE